MVKLNIEIILFLHASTSFKSLSGLDAINSIGSNHAINLQDLASVVYIDHFSVAALSQNIFARSYIEVKTFVFVTNTNIFY